MGRASGAYSEPGFSPFKGWSETAAFPDSVFLIDRS